MPLDLFVGRTNELQRYQKFLTRETPWVLIIRGLGGSGKSTLLTELKCQTPEDTSVVTLDFADKTLREDYLTLLENISEQVEQYCEAEQTVEFRKSIATGRSEIGKRLPGGSTEINETITASYTSNISGVRQTIDLGQAQLQETRRQMREVARAKFYDQMKTFKKKRLVIMLDTCEWLNETAEAEAALWAGTELMKGLRSRMRNQEKSCYVVMTSRVPLQLEGINDVEQEQVKLMMLNRAETNDYLEAMAIDDPALQNYIYTMTYGHPHSIAIISDICEQNWRDEPLKATNLPILREQFYESAKQDIIDKDVLKRLLKSPLDELTRYGVILRRFNLPLLQAVFEEWLPEPEALKRFEQLTRYPHVEPLGNYNYAFNMLLREILSGYIRVQEPDKWRRYHQLALEFLKSDFSLVSIDFPDWYYHQLACDEEKGVSYWNEVKTRESPEFLDALREVARDKTLKLAYATLQCMDIQTDTTRNTA